MNNLIENSDWAKEYNGMPEFFSFSTPITYDCFSYKCNRTASVTVPSCGASTAVVSYIPEIDLNCACALSFGITVRAVEVENLNLAAEFIDGNGNTIENAVCPVAEKVCGDFSKVRTVFRVPQGACTVRLSFFFFGKVTAATFCCPEACIVQ